MKEFGSIPIGITNNTHFAEGGTMLRHLVAILAVLLLGLQSARAQYQMSLENDVTVDTKTYEFDVIIRSTSGTINLTSYQFFLTYNAAIVNGGTLSFTYIGGTSASALSPMGTGIYPDGASNLGTGSSAGSDGIDVAGKRLGRFRLKNTVDFAQVAANLAWDFSGALKTVVNVDNANATSPGSHVNLLGNAPLPITLSSFTLQRSLAANGVELAWTTISEINNYGFYIQRRAENDNAFADIPESFVAGHGTTLEPQSYSYTDYSVLPGTWYYRLRQVDLDGAVHFSDELRTELLTSVVESAPRQFALEQNYPNPFNPSTEIKFSVEATDHATVRVYNMLGQHIATLFEGVAEAGRYYRVRFEGTGLSSGIYLYSLQSGSKTELRKLVLLK
jgi:hypothetical protein